MKKVFLSIIVALAGATSWAQESDSDAKLNESLAPSGSVNGYEFVDLGLPSGTMWATCNVGATEPVGYGTYYAWGETSPKTSYIVANCTTYTTELTDISGNPAYDAATAQWGSAWRMPTIEQLSELMDSCVWQWIEYKGVNGYVVTGKNGKSIFLPASGHREGVMLCYAGSCGYYWSSTPDSGNTNNAHRMYFNSSDRYKNCQLRYDGRAIRAVTSNR